ncbi:uncharacterized protein N7515_003918 [Penicillium bovifimosum]|uniref:Uncharacterized protein n=1 Tax=Penicillium bovifimosum TaxID=126998 RepID=A0A9W9H5J7_9EURO|nr:uncharacterized protein N7515_003918 [Penicillium bovifimosum]KAJ5139070.1 hypothetical protein N7515_003918 [Penicillium bovifimosum]
MPSSAASTQPTTWRSDELVTAENPVGLQTYECWFCPLKCLGFSALLYHLEQGFCVKRYRIRTLAFEGPQRGLYGTKPRHTNAFFCFNCGNHFPEVSWLFQHAEKVPACSHLLNADECLGRLRAFYINYYDCPGMDFTQS